MVDVFLAGGSGVAARKEHSSQQLGSPLGISRLVFEVTGGMAVLARCGPGRQLPAQCGHVQDDEDGGCEFLGQVSYRTGECFGSPS